jgi:hypothetical protein
MKKILIISIFSVTIAFAFDFGSMINSFTTDSNSASTVSKTTATSLSSATVASGLKEALKKGVKYAVANLGKKDGYLGNSLVKIPLPENLSKAEKLVRKFGGDKVADNLIDSMNTAATKAAPKTADIFVQAIDKMTMEDAKKILAGNKDGATQYFKKHTTSSLQKMISPIVKEMMKKNSVAKYYDVFNNYYSKYGKKYIENSSVMSIAKSFGADSYLPSSSDKNLDQYVTDKAIDGLFKMIAQKEADIRANPIARTSSILKQVFGN